jgi:MarR family transcriptional regulator, organic hydroperoxide resistance regulator
MVCAHTIIVYIRIVMKELKKLKQEDSIDFHIRWAWYNISRMYNAQAADFEGSMSLGYALLNIEENGTPSTKLAPKMGMEPRSLTRMIKALEENGLITKEIDVQDKRLVKLFLTKEGKKRRDIAKSIVLNFNKMVREIIPEEDLKTTFNVLTKVNELIDKNKLYTKN